MEISMSKDKFEIPKWDVALEALISEEYKKSGTGLNIDTYIDLAKQHGIRFDDIIFTLFELCYAGQWKYVDEQGHQQPITKESVAELFVGGRIKEEDMRGYTGLWSPIDQ